MRTVGWIIIIVSATGLTLSVWRMVVTHDYLSWVIIGAAHAINILNGREILRRP